MDQSDAKSVGIFLRWTNQTQEAWVYSHDGPIRRRKHGYILTMDQSDAKSAGIFSKSTSPGSATALRTRTERAVLRAPHFVKPLLSRSTTGEFHSPPNYCARFVRAQRGH
eukprot:1185607-Prorocentrum_minimum.AAC.1